MKEGRIFSDDRGGFMLLEADDGAEVMELLGSEMLDNVRVETRPTATFDDLASFFEREHVG
jgi:hypothetical protein